MTGRLARDGPVLATAAEGVAYVVLGNPLYPPLLTMAGRDQLTAAGVAADAVLAAGAPHPPSPPRRGQDR